MFAKLNFLVIPVKTDVITEVKEKINRLKTPRYASRRPVLIHVNGVVEDVLESQYFSDVIDFGQMLEQQT